MERLQRTLGLASLVALAAGAAAAFVHVEQLKVEAPLIDRVDFRQGRTFSPLCVRAGLDTRQCRHAARFAIGLPHRTAYDVAIVRTSDGATVRTLATDARWRRVVRLSWDGRDRAGALLPDGTYKVRVRLRRYRIWRTINVTVRLDTTPPVVRLRAAPRATIAPRSGRYRMRVDGPEEALVRLVVYPTTAERTIGSNPVYVSARAAIDRTFTWRGVLGGSAVKSAPAGTYVVGVRAIDAAGNVTVVPASGAAGSIAPAGIVRVRTVDLRPDGRVLTTAPTASLVRRRLVNRFPGAFERRVAGPPATLRLPRPGLAGLYVLTASAGGSSVLGYQAVPGGAQTVAVVPTYTWQVANDYDGDGDGFPDAPPQPLLLNRPLDAGAQLRRLARDLRPLLAAHASYGAQTDESFQAHGAPRGTRILVLVDAEAWTPAMAARVRAFAARGGLVVLLHSPLASRVARVGEALVAHGVTQAMPLPHRVFRSYAAALRALPAVPTPPLK
jgi:hypothetical protein